MSLRYISKPGFEGYHTGTISALSFSPKGKYLASGSMDGSLVTWLTATGNPLFVVSCHFGFVSLSWINETVLLAGRLDGVAILLEVSETTLTATAIRAHQLPIEQISIASSAVATGASHEVRIWDIVGSRLQRKTRLSAPPNAAGLRRGADVYVTSIHWAPSISSQALLVSYLNHGVVLWDTTTLEVLKHLPLDAPIGRTSLSPNKPFLVVANMSTGFDIYDISNFENNAPSLTIDCALDGSLRPPVLYVHQGHAFASGSQDGSTYLWDGKTGKRIQKLSSQINEQGRSVVSAMADSYNLHRDRFYIASASFHQSKPNNASQYSVRVWVAQVPQVANARNRRLEVGFLKMLLSILCLVVSLGLVLFGAVKQGG